MTEHDQFLVTDIDGIHRGYRRSRIPWYARVFTRCSIIPRGFICPQKSNQAAIDDKGPKWNHHG